MKISADLLYELDRLRNSNFKWRLIATLIAITLVFFIFNENTDKITGKYIARVNIEGIIYENQEMILALNDLADDNQVVGIILHINSPGGSPYASEEILYSLRKASTNNKPIAAVIGTLGASGGYMIALAGDNIFARNTSLTGSIGVILETVDASELAKKIGIRINNYKIPSLKGEPSLTSKPTPEANEAIQSLVNDCYLSFINLVSERRNLSKDYLIKISDGRAYTGKQALKLKLIDQIGGEDEAVAWLENSKNLPKDLPIIDYKISKDPTMLKTLLAPASQIYKNVFDNFVFLSITKMLNFK